MKNYVSTVYVSLRVPFSQDEGQDQDQKQFLVWMCYWFILFLVSPTLVTTFQEAVDDDCNLPYVQLNFALQSKGLP